MFLSYLCKEIYRIASFPCRNHSFERFVVPYTTLKLMNRLNEREGVTLSLFFSTVLLTIKSPKEQWSIYDAQVYQQACFVLNKVL